jgi:hypothetical protein
MSNEKFTKGEWVIEEVEEAGFRNTNSLCLCVVTRDFDVISPVLGIRNNHDAHLIAAAPEMYALLKFLVENDSINDHSIDKEVLTLLTKARGDK